LSLQGSEEQIFRLERQTIEIVARAKPNAVGRVGMSAGRNDNITDDEGGARLSGFSGRIVQEIRAMVDHAIFGSRPQDTADGVAAISKRHVLS